MRIHTKALFLLLALAVPPTSLELRAQDFAVEEMAEEPTTAPKPFSILRVERFDGGIRLFLNTGDPRAIANLMATGALEAQFSDNERESESPVRLSLGKAIWCGPEDEPRYLPFQDPIPGCENNTPARVEYFLAAPVIPGTGSDLAIGLDPDYLWLIEGR